MVTKNIKPFISIVVLNWNGKQFLDPLICSFLEQNYPHERLELILADNASSDDSEQYIREKYKDIKRLSVIQNGGNYGYAGGNNRGMAHAKGDYILVCNNDLELDSNLVSELVNVAQKESVAATVPKLMYLNKPGYINNAGSEINPNSSWPIYEIGANEKDEGQYDSVREISAFCGACVLFSREFLENIGLFDEKFFMYFEDGDLSWRGQKRSFRYFYSPKAIAYHEHTGTSKEGSPLFNYYVGRNRLLIMMKNANFKTTIKSWVVVLRDQLFIKLKLLIKSIVKREGQKTAIKDLFLGLKILSSAAFLAPYCYLKRWNIIKEKHL